jgi:hypothetical protein
VTLSIMTLPLTAPSITTLRKRAQNYGTHKDTQNYNT